MSRFKVAVICYSLIFVTLFISVIEILYFWSILNDNVSYKTKTTRNSYQFIGAECKNIQWMVQVTDLHFSDFHDPTRKSEFEEFCSITLDVIRPRVVLATGDITDAVLPKFADSTQIENEWKAYKEILDKSNVTSKTTWLDIRGNHDTFNVLSTNSSNNFFEKYSVQGRDHPRSYFYVGRMDNGEKIGYIAVDSCLNVGLKILYNFAGEMTKEEIDVIRSYVRKAHDLDVKYLIWFGHYPTSSIQYPGSKILRDLIANEETSVAFLSGHMHQVDNLVPKMYSYMKEGLFELELADWKTNRIFRIMTIDHGQFSFVDVKHGKWPIIIVTNPKTEVLVSPATNFFASPPNSSHIRLLVFSRFPITKVRLKIDNEEWKNCVHVDQSFYVIEWDQNLYQNGLHTITVEAEDEQQNVQKIDHIFSLNGSRSDRRFLSKFFLMPNLGLLIQSAMIFFVLLCVVPLILFRYLVTVQKVEADEMSAIKYNYLIQCFQKFCVISHLKRFFYPLLIFPIYILLGPWAIVYMLDNKIGVLLSWGIFIDGKYEPPSWLLNGLGLKQILVHLFLIIHFSNEIHKRLLNKRSCFSISKSTSKNYLCIAWDNSFFVFILMVQIIQIILFCMYIGISTLFIGPLTSWWLIMAIWLKRDIICMEEDELSYLRQKWHPAL
ncbi:transmembrane protein 62-like [Planococcus citri]|uniref:transmembrane protein 62-like n=1 Tax=Planococcus citri TaxID=170843 RepID=UPI0031FA2D4A